MKILDMVLTVEISNDFFKYINLLMEEVYKVFFHNKLHRVFLEMEALHFSPDRKIGDWFLLEDHTVIRMYGFSHEPYILLAFVTPIFFSLEFDIS